MGKSQAVWTKAERTKALAAEFKRAGFSRQGADWVLERNDLRWLTFLSVIRDSEGDIYEVTSALYRVSKQGVVDTSDVIEQFGLGDLLGVDPQSTYDATAQGPEDPLLRDVREHLLPMVEKLTSTTDVVRAMIDGELVVLARAHEYAIAPVLFGWDAARRLGLLEEVERVERILASKDWDHGSRRYYAKTAKDWGARIALQPPASRAWADRFRLHR